ASRADPRRCPCADPDIAAPLVSMLPRGMTIGTSIVLIAVGAILKYAVTAHVSGIDLQTVGTILIIVGILALIISLLYTFAWSGRRNRTDYYDERPPPRQPPPRY